MAQRPPRTAGGRSIGVALCTYRGERFVREQLQSYAGQSVLPDVITVSDDRSDDGTLDIVKDFARTAPFVVTIVDGPGDGVAANFEHALRETDTDIVFLSDQDDVWRPDKVETMLSRVPDDPIALVFSDARLVDKEGSPLGLTLFDSLRMTPTERALPREAVLPTLIKRNIVAGATALLTRELVRAALPIPRPWIHDEWLAAFAALAGSVVAIDDTLIDYRQHGGNAIGTVSPTVRARLHRMRTSSPNRFRYQRERAEALRAAAAALGLADDRAALVDEKWEFEQRRASMPSARLMRPPTVLRLAARGRYARLASQGNLDVVRDLLVK